MQQFHCWTEVVSSHQTNSYIYSTS